MSEKPNRVPRTPWLAICTLLGAFLGFLACPAIQGNGMTFERDMWIQFWFPVGGALAGLAIGVLADIRDQLRRRRD